MFRLPTLAAAAACLVSCQPDAGPKGEAGEAGAPGALGGSRTVVQNADGSATVSCPDGTTATVGGAPGEDGRTSLVALADEPPGANCDNGGRRLDAGVDDNGNGLLDAGEITTSQFFCAAEVLAPIDIDGDLVIDEFLDAVLLPPIASVSGDLVISAAGLTGFSADELVSVGGLIDVSRAASLTELSLVNLQSAGGFTTETEIITDDGVLPATADQLRTLRLPRLTAAGSIELVSALVELDLEALETTQSLVVNNAALSALSLPALETAETITVLDLPNVVSVDLGALTSFDELSVRLLPLLTTVTGLERVTTFGELRTAATPSLTGPDLPAATEADVLSIEGSALASLSGFGALERLTTLLVVASNPSLVSLDLSRLEAVPFFGVADNPQLPDCRVTELLERLSPAPQQVLVGGNGGPDACP